MLLYCLNQFAVLYMIISHVLEPPLICKAAGEAVCGRPGYSHELLPSSTRSRLMTVVTTPYVLSDDVNAL